MKKILVLLVIYLPMYILAQSNSVYVSDIQLQNKSERWCWSISQDSFGNMLFGVERGVVIFDGTNQELIKTKSLPLAILNNNDNKVWLCGNEYTGVLDYTDEIGYNYLELENKEDIDYNKIFVLNDTVYFISDYEILRYNAKTNQKIDALSTNNLIIDKVVEFNGILYFIIEYFLHIINNNQLTELDKIDFPVDYFTYGVSINDQTLILGTMGNTYYSFNGKSFKSYELTSPFFDNNMVTSGNLLSDSTIILSSLAGGIAVFDFNKRKILNQVGFFNGLPDDEIRTTFIDRDNGIWVSHEFGISRLDLNQGIESYSYYPGLKGNPIAIKYFDNNLYVGTNDGLFVLDEIKDYDEITVKVKIPSSVNVVIPVNKYQKENSEPDSDDKKGFFSRLLSKKEDTKSSTTPEKDNKKARSKKGTPTKTVQKTRLIKKRSLKSISHYFTLIEKMSGKYTQMVEYKNFLLIAGNNGLFAVKDKKAEPVLKNTYIVDIYKTSLGDELYCSTNNGLYRIYLANDKWEIDHFAQTTSSLINSVTQEKNGNWIIAYEDILIRAKLKYNKIEIIHEIKLPEMPGQTFIVKNINDSVLAFTSSKIYHFESSGELNEIKEMSLDSYVIANQNNLTWLYNNAKWNIYSSDNIKINANTILRLNLFGTLRYIDMSQNGDVWLINDDNHLFKLNPLTNSSTLSDFKVSIIEIQSENKELEIKDNISLNSRRNNLTARLSAPFYLLQNSVYYSYVIDGLDKQWSDWSTNSVLKLGYIPPGEYILKFKAKNTLGFETETQNLEINVPKPFTQTILFYAILLVAFATITYIIFKIRLQKLKKDKQILEQKVKERTATIQEQKSHIEKQHEEITGSIRYAKRIQTAMLPHDEIIEAMLPHSFILFNPRDIVSGDFYFFKPVGNAIAFVAADCTGHGVPGGFMSMLGMSFLGEITSQLPIPSASEIIDHLREKIKLTLGQDEVDSTQKDGMDLAICVIDIDNKQIQYSGAFNPLIMIRNGELDVVKADRQPVAVYIKETDFTNHIIDVQDGDCFYMFSDGFPDQIGGPKQRKFMSKNFKNLIHENHKLPMPEQKIVLQKSLNDWRGDSMQVDDILVIGFSL